VLELIVADILDRDAMLRATRGTDVVVHLAANTGVEPSVRDPHADCVTNVLGTLNCLEAARHAGVGRFVFASSGAPLGDTEPPVHEGKVPRPASPYGASKLAGEGYCSAYFRTFGVETVALRFGNVYGPGSTHKDSVVAKFIKQALAGEPLAIYGNGGQTRDFIHVEDLLEAVCKAATAPGVGGEVFQIATARETTVRDLARLITTILVEFGLLDVAVRHKDPRLGDVMRTYADTSKARRMLGWQATVTLEEGLRSVVSWFLEQSGTSGRRRSLPASGDPVVG
jgi:UDP-glucose 4-epimerase